MPEPLYPFNPKSFEEVKQYISRVMEEMSNERIGMAIEGDVFAVDNESDIFTLNIASTGGLEKTSGELAVKCDTDGPMVLSADGLDINPVSTTKKGATPILSNVATEFLNGQGAWTVPGGGMTPASTVTDETSFGISPNVGASDNYAREDHTHGTPPEAYIIAIGVAMGW